jgi:hypothetical protein
VTTRCKFTCISKREYPNWTPGQANLYEYEFSAVTSGSDENKAFFAATPSGSLKVSTVKDGSFQVGQAYFLDLWPAV